MWNWSTANDCRYCAWIVGQHSRRYDRQKTKINTLLVVPSVYSLREVLSAAWGAGNQKGICLISFVTEIQLYERTIDCVITIFGLPTRWQIWLSTTCLGLFAYRYEKVLPRIRSWCICVRLPFRVLSAQEILRSVLQLTIVHASSTRTNVYKNQREVIEKYLSHPLDIPGSRLIQESMVTEPHVLTVYKQSHTPWFCCSSSKGISFGNVNTVSRFRVS